ncbi:MAG: polysaccharide deacetylase family protein [Candidatus Omnitrophica bacterium]|nr:polysaccharide deacetylase family protein [Candidatus Omnitrophota bacterium]
MKKSSTKRLIIVLAILLALAAAGVAAFTMFFDQAVIVRRNTVYHVERPDKVVAITFDDGPSPVWTPKILNELKQANIKATFFMLGMHVEKYPEIARQVAEEGHEIGNHSYDHHGLIYYTNEELETEVNRAEKVIKDATGVKTIYFRPPKAWVTDSEKNKLKEMGYKVVLWSLNSKDWVTFDNKYMIKYILNNIRPGDIILFHDSGGVFSTEGGDRHETVLTIQRLAEKLREKGYKFVTITELLNVKNDEVKK